jgi:hypothetical protein
MPIYKKHRSKKQKLDFTYKLNKESDMLNTKRFDDENIKSLLEFLRPEKDFTSEQNAMRFCRCIVKDLAELISQDMILNANAYVFPKWRFGHIAIYDHSKKKESAEMNWDTDGANYLPRVVISTHTNAFNKKHYTLTLDKKAKALLDKHISEGNRYGN